MSTDQDLIRSLSNVMKLLLNRQLTQNDMGCLIHHFNRSQGSVVERAVHSLGVCSGMTLDAILDARDESDEVDEAMTDLETVLMNWRVGD